MSNWKYGTKNLLKFPILFESSWFQSRFFKTTSPCLLWLPQSTFFYFKVFFNTLLPRKNLDIEKLCDPKSRKVEEFFLFLKINGAFHKKKVAAFQSKTYYPSNLSLLFANLNVICSICFLKSQQYCSNGVKNSTRLWIDSMIQYNSYKANGCICHIEVLIKIFNL